MRSPYTPGVAGYAIALLVSALVVLVPAVLVLGPYAVYVAVVWVLFGLPIGIVGLALTHLGCRDAPSQRAHVLVAGLWGYGLTLLVTVVAGGDLGFVLALPTGAGISAAIGRASVIGQVPERQARSRAQ